LANLGLVDKLCGQKNVGNCGKIWAFIFCQYIVYLYAYYDMSQEMRPMFSRTWLFLHPVKTKFSVHSRKTYRRPSNSMDPSESDENGTGHQTDPRQIKLSRFYTGTSVSLDPRDPGARARESRQVARPQRTSRPKAGRAAGFDPVARSTAFLI